MDQLVNGAACLVLSLGVSAACLIAVMQSPLILRLLLVPLLATTPICGIAGGFMLYSGLTEKPLSKLGCPQLEEWTCAAPEL